MRLKPVLAPVLAAGLFATLLVQLPMAIASRAGDYDMLDPIIEVNHILKSSFADESRLNDDKMRTAMLNAMVDSLGDPHTVYVPATDEANFNKELRGKYVGIGAEVNIVDDYLTIISPMDGSPALAAGVMAGDIVLEIEGVSTHKMPVDKCIDLLMGEPGTPVMIKVRHLDGVEATMTVVRNHIVTRTVKGLFRNGEKWNWCVDGALGIVYIRVTQFNDDTVDELVAALGEAQGSGSGVNGLILDLRDNPGGGLTTAVEMADLFLAEGDIVSIKSRDGANRTYSAKLEGTLPEFPMVVLVNGFSASASEIVAGSLQENSRAKVLGTRSFGKGSVQEVRDLEFNRGTLKYTTALYYLPSGRNITRNDDSTVWGVDPDPGFLVPVSDEKYIEKLRARRDHEIIRATNGELPQCADGTWIRDHLKDEQLALALQAVQARLSGAQWPKVGIDSDAALVAFDQELHRQTELRARIREELALVEDRISELENTAEGAGRLPLLPRDLDLVNGRLTIQDKNGNTIGTYIINGGDVELALNAVQLTPVANN